MRILLIDDEETNARFLQALLTKAMNIPEAVEVHRVGRLYEALRELDDGPRFDAILLDLGLPECGGLTSLRLVRAHAPLIPVVVVTGLEDPEIAAGAIAAGASDFLVKGRFGPRRLSDALAGLAPRRPIDPADGPTAPLVQGAFYRPGPTGGDDQAEPAASGEGSWRCGESGL